MNPRSHCAKALRVLAALGVTACSSLSNVASPSAPFFIAEGEEAKFYRAAARTQDAELARCATTNTCDRAHFTRGLIALFESRESAMRHFQDVVTMVPKSHLAASSRSWIHLLRETPVTTKPESLMVVTTKLLVRDMLQQELDARRNVEELTTQLRKSEDLENQLEALKRIQQEIKERSRPIKPPTKLSESPTPEGPSSY
jgi:hypothetical protein